MKSTSCFLLTAVFQVFMIGLFIATVMFDAEFGENGTSKRNTLDRKQPRDGDEYLYRDKAIKNNNNNFIEVATGVFVYSAYYDNRDGRNLRLVALVQDPMYGDHGDVFCDFSGARVEATIYWSPEGHALQYTACLLSCEMPYYIDASQLGQGVTLESDDGTRTTFDVNNVKEIGRDRVQFAVCVPPLFGNLSSANIDNFIVLTQVLGAEKIIFYEYFVNNDVKLGLQRYQKSGLVEIKPWNMTLRESNVWYFGQSACIWDCMFHTMYSAEWIVFNDLDEYIVPKTDIKWYQMIRNLQRNVEGKYIVAYEFPSYLFKMNDIWPQTTNIVGNNDKLAPSFSLNTEQFLPFNTFKRYHSADATRTKTILNPRLVFEPQIHRLGKPLFGNGTALKVNESVAAVHHYREKEEQSLRMSRWRMRNEVLGLVEDRTILRYQEDFDRYVET